MDRRKCFSYLLLIIALAAFFRLWDLGVNPPSLFRDEAEKGYSAYSIARTGGYFYFGDIGGRTELLFDKWPLFTNVFGVHTSAIYQYLDAPFVGIFGLNEITIRLPAALAGIATVLLTFYLALAWTDDRMAALLSAFLVAISPWHILFSRWALQGIFLPLLIPAGLLAFNKGIGKKPVFLLLSGWLFGLAFYSYAVGRLFIPVFLVCLFFIYRKEIIQKPKWCAGAAAVFLAIALPTFIYYITGGRSARFGSLSVFGGDRSFLEGFIQFVRNYIAHYRPKFLFFAGDENPRHSLPIMGQMYFFEAPLLLYGLWLTVRRGKKHHKLLLAWFFTFPVSAAMTTEGIPHALRSITALPMVHIITGLAAANLVSKILIRPRKVKEADEKKWNKGQSLQIVAFLAILIIFLNVVRMGLYLFREYPAETAKSWQYGIKDALKIVESEGADPADIYISGSIPYAPYLVMVYEKTNPESIKKKGSEALGYQFLPPVISLEDTWARLPEDSWLITRAFSHPVVPPAFFIYYSRRDSGLEPIVPLYQVYHKK